MIPAELPQQPAGLRGLCLHDYQMHGLRWMLGLHDLGLNGILADDMGAPPLPSCVRLRDAEGCCMRSPTLPPPAGGGAVRACVECYLCVYVSVLPRRRAWQDSAGHRAHDTARGAGRGRPLPHRGARLRPPALARRDRALQPAAARRRVPRHLRRAHRHVRPRGAPPAVSACGATAAGQRERMWGSIGNSGEGRSRVLPPCRSGLRAART